MKDVGKNYFIVLIKIITFNLSIGVKSVLRFFLFLSVLMSGSCTVYTEKQSQALSKVVHATKDSLDAARIDLADVYASEAIKIVKPPKNRIEIQSMYEKITISTTPTTPEAKSEITKDKRRVVVIPEKYKHDTVIVVSSVEYDILLKDKENFEQLKVEQETLTKAKREVDEELNKQAEYKDQMIKDLNNFRREIAEKNLTIFKLFSALIGICFTIGGYIFLKLKGLIPF